MALQQVHGNARSIAVARIQRETRLLRRELRDHSSLCITIFKELSNIVLTAQPGQLPQKKKPGSQWAKPRRQTQAGVKSRLT